jgi:hypothetical protein
VPSATGGSGLVRRPAGLRTAVRTGRRPAAASPSAVGTATPAEMGRRFPAVGLGQDIATRHRNSCARKISDLLSGNAIRLPEQPRASQLADAAHDFGKRVTGGKAPAKARLQCAQVRQDRIAQSVIAPVGDLVDNLVRCAVQANVFE